VPVATEIVESVHRQVDASGLEGLAGLRGFFPGPSAGAGRRQDDTRPLVMVAGGRGFTP